MHFCWGIAHVWHCVNNWTLELSFSPVHSIPDWSHWLLHCLYAQNKVTSIKKTPMLTLTYRFAKRCLCKHILYSFLNNSAEHFIPWMAFNWTPSLKRRHQLKLRNECRNKWVIAASDCDNGPLYPGQIKICTDKSMWRWQHLRRQCCSI